MFLIARDREERLLNLLRGIPARETPGFEATTPDGTGHRLWRIEERADLETLTAAAGAEPLLIADGHHRYETALELARRHPEWDGAARLLVCLVPRSDRGLLLLPTHRALARPPDGRTWREALGETFEVCPLDHAPSPGELAELVGTADADGTMGVLAGRPGGAWAATLRPRRNALARAGLEPPESGVASILLDRLLLRKAYGLGPDDAAEAGLLDYHRGAADAADAAGAEGAAFLLPPMELETVWKIARSGGRLPPKSTYFWPKLPSGLLFRRF